MEGGGGSGGGGDGGVASCLCNESTGFSSAEIIDSRPATIGRRRRRKCKLCERRFTTYEIELAENEAYFITTKHGLYKRLCKVEKRNVVILEGEPDEQ